MALNNPYQPNESRLPPGTCEHFATKGLYLAREDKAQYESHFEAGTSSFWCVLTQKPYGPDGLEVAPEACGRSRACCLARLDPLPRA